MVRTFFYAKKNYFHFPPSSYLYQPYPLRVITIKLTCQLLAAASSSMVWPGCNSVATKSLKVSSDDGSADNALAADEEEDIAMYRRWRRAVCLTRSRFPKRESKEGRRAVFKS